MKAKQSSSNIKKPALIMGIAFIALGCTLGVSSFAWFLLPSSTKKVNGVDGEATGSYFSYVNEKTKIADGTETNPYGIQNARQLYYFNWLQDLGYFNKDEDKDGKIDQQYFVLMNDIGASEYVLPPAGTTEYPFVGNFDGQGHKISGLTISNSWSSLKDKPSKAQSTDDKKVTLNNAEIVGFFGVVGEYEGDAEVSGYTVSVNEVKDLYFDDLKIETASSSTLVGLIAGYANGQLTNCGVHKGYFDFQYKDSSGDLAAPSVISSGALAGNDKLSQYSLIGAYNDNHFKYSGKPADGGSSTGSQWGGSIDITSLERRLYYIAGSSSISGTTFSSNGTQSYDKDKYNAYFRSNPTTGSTLWNADKATIQYLYDGTYLPLNVDTDTAFSGSTGAYSGDPIKLSDSGNRTSWTTTSFYQDNSTEWKIIKNSNTGYLVGGGNSSDKKYIYVRKEQTINQTGTSGISNSVTGSSYSSSSTKFYTVDTTTGNSTSEITSSIASNLKRYSTVKADFDTQMEGKNYCYAIRFQPINPTLTSNWSTGVTVKIGGSEKTNYEFLKSAINFTVSKSGYITVIMSSYGSMGKKLFDLFKIDRNSDNSINKITQITKIYGEADSGSYNYDDTSKSSNLLFNFDNAHSLNDSSFYYFEIPVNAGDYAICKYSTSEGTTDNSTGFLNYLDIGANSGTDPTPTPTTKEIPPIDFVYYSDAKNKTIKPMDSTKEVTGDDGTQTTVSDYEPSKVTFAISGSPTTVYFYRVRSVSSDGTETITVYYVNFAGTSAATVAKTGADTIAEGTAADYGKDEDTTSGGTN